MYGFELTEQEKQEICTRYKNDPDVSLTGLAELYGVSSETIRQVLISGGIERRTMGPKRGKRRGSYRRR